MTLTCASLFCGCGGLDLGFHAAGFETIWANDFSKEACGTFRAWNPSCEVICGDISMVESSSIPKTDVILGGFPCQGFSMAGPRKLDDSRNSLYRHYVRIVRDKQPRIFVGENVKGLLTMDGGRVIQAIVDGFSDCGYDVFYRLVNASDYGVPQDRERVIITGFRKDLGVSSYRLPDCDGEKRTLRDAIGNFPPPSPGEVCSSSFSSRYMSRNRKRGWDEVSFTIPAMAKQVAIHPSSPDMVKVERNEWKFGEGVTRRLSWRECAAIQTFPEWMAFCGDLTSIYRQIGNAVPVRLAQFVASEVMKFL